jgi:hypothetical protein
MKFGLVRFGAAPATIQGERDRPTNTRQAAAVIVNPGLGIDCPGVLNVRNNHKRANGITVAKAKPNRPRGTVRDRLPGDKAREMLLIQPTMTKTEKRKRRFVRPL